LTSFSHTFFPCISCVSQICFLDHIFRLTTLLQSSPANETVDGFEHRQSSTVVEYFGFHLTFSIPPLRPFARLFTVAGYNSTKNRLNGLYRNNVSYYGPGSSRRLNPSRCFDSELGRYIRMEASDISSDTCGVPSCSRKNYVNGTFGGRWTRDFFVSHISLLHALYPTLPEDHDVNSG
jgi:hypothetical protein